MHVLTDEHLDFPAPSYRKDQRHSRSRPLEHNKKPPLARTLKHGTINEQEQQHSKSESRFLVATMFVLYKFIIIPFDHFDSWDYSTTTFYHINQKSSAKAFRGSYIIEYKELLLLARRRVISAARRRSVRGRTVARVVVSGSIVIGVVVRSISVWVCERMREWVRRRI
jgi:hypothetical protein